MLSSPCMLPHVEASDGAPTARFGHRMVYDPVNQRVLLFGGAVWDDGYTFYDDLWSYDPAADMWELIECSPRPPSRFNPMMVYDPDRHQLLLFGGYGAEDRIGDTWTYDIEANEWTQLHPSVTPSPRSDAAMAYDEANDIIVLHDGYCRGGAHPGDTWVYDPAEGNWTQMSPEESPMPQYGHHMVYDSVNAALVMYGGHWSITENGVMSHGYSDGVWMYDYPSDTWTKVDTATSLPRRYWHALAYDSDRGKMAVFGGSGENDAVLGDTWLYDLSADAWERLDTDDGPPSRENSALVYDPVHGALILFGGLMEIGEPSLDDLWVLDVAEGTWREASPGSVSTDTQEGSSESTTAEGEEDPGQTGIPGFTLPSIILGVALAVLLSAGVKPFKVGSRAGVGKRVRD
ncbi:hypothetical protein JXL21_07935 [Candidatus Bathyarchaeota archaeon]|nr:hypothetical protein [Candidatus Bathyarchaeota archaeon]